MPALTTGMFRGMLREKNVRVSTWAGSTEDLAGSRRTSSKVSASGIGPSIISSSMPSQAIVEILILTHSECFLKYGVLTGRDLGTAPFPAGVSREHCRSI